ncbi:MAG: DUF2062 domain-containing protein [Pseudomonadota bacterium]
MPRRFFKSISPSRRHVIAQRWLNPVRHLLDSPNLWAIRRRAVAPGVAVGLFWAWLPMPGHTFWAGLSAIALKVHLPLSMILTWVTNPLTILPMYYAAYRLGGWVLGMPPREFTFEMSLDWLTGEFVAIWQPLVLGCVLAGALSALIGYVLVDLLWRTRVGDYLRERQARIRHSRA